MVNLRAKWGKSEFDIQVDIAAANRSDNILSTISEKTNIPKDKIKIIPPSILASNSALKDGMKVTVIGTAQDQQLNAVPEPPRTQFIEDMTPDEIAIALRQRRAGPLPVGLENLGNTCYLNAVMQCLARLPTLRYRLSNPAQITSPSTPASDIQLLNQVSGLLHSMSAAHSESFSPILFVSAIRSRFPQFNQRDSHGHFAQQDAEEYLRSLLQVLSASSPRIDSLFNFSLESTWKCLESESEPVSKIHEEHKSLTCHMGTQLEPVSHLHEGVQLSLRETISKEASTLGRTAKFEKRSGISSLPACLIVQFARFQWKAKSDSAGTEATKTKITRRVTFQKTLDLYDMCTEEVKVQLDVGREQRRVLIEGGALLEDVQAAMDPDVSDRLPTGVYELVGIVSHQGRTSDGGHYVAWTKRPESVTDKVSSGEEPPVKKNNSKKENQDNDIWLKFDDEYVSETNWTAMTETGGLLGGLADSQMAYLLMYVKTSVPAPVQH